MSNTPKKPENFIGNLVGSSMIQAIKALVIFFTQEIPAACKWGWKKLVWCHNQIMRIPFFSNKKWLSIVILAIATGVLLFFGHKVVLTVLLLKAVIKALGAWPGHH